jgi:hypothetical protein
MLVFSTQLCELLPLSPLPCVNKYTVYTYTVCKGGYGVLGLRQIITCGKVPLKVNFCWWLHFALPSMSLIFRRGTPSPLPLSTYYAYKKACFPVDHIPIPLHGPYSTDNPWIEGKHDRGVVLPHSPRVQLKVNSKHLSYLMAWASLSAY